MSPAEISAAQDRSWSIPELASAPKIDGRIDDEVWEQAALRVNIPYEVWPSDNDVASVRTEAFLGHTKTHLYAAFRAYDPDPKSIRARLADRDTVWDDDSVGLILDTFNNQREAYYFNVNPLGIQMDRAGRGRGDSSWNGVWNSRGRLYEWGYAVEIEIPFSTLRFQPGSSAQTWGFDVQRTWPRDNRRTMSSVPRNRNIDCILCQYPKVSGFRGIDAGSNFEVVPTLTGGRADVAGEDGELVAGGENVDVGGTVRWGMTPSLTLSATANPDFSQVEADVAQLEVNRTFAINFPEARPFFLEGADSFSTPLRAVQTRSIVQPSWGLKLTGQQGPNGLGVFVVEDEVTNLLLPGRQGSSTTTLDGGSTAAVVSYNRNLGQRSRLGVLATQREGVGYENSVGGVHGFFALSQSDSLRAQVLLSDTLYPETDSLESADLSDHAMRLSYRHESRDWEWGAEMRDVGDDFRADLGFMPRVGFRQYEGSLRRQWRQNAGALWNQQSVDVRRNRLEDADGLALNDSASLGYSISGKWQSRFSFGAYFGESTWNGSEFDGDGHWLDVSARPVGSFEWGMSSNWGDSIDFTHTRQAESLRISPRVAFDFGRRLRLRMNHTVQQLDVEGGQLFEANLSQLRMVYQFNARTFVRAIVQYRDLARNADLYADAVDPLTERLFNQLLFSYKLNPATVFFLGYSDDRLGGEELDPLGNLQFTDLEQTSRTFFLKLGYRWLM